MKKLFLPAIFISLFITELSFSQCSDAGVCIIGKRQKIDSTGLLSAVTLGYSLGMSGINPDVNGALNDLIFNTAALDVDLSITSRSRLGLSIPFSEIEGPLGQSSGIGDLSVLYSYGFVIKKKYNLTISIGGKLSIADVNTIDSLPQRYMPGLGTNDLIAGATYSFSGYSISAAYQKPFGRSTNFKTRLKRGDDFLFRAGYGAVFNKISFKAEILTILRIQKSSILAYVDSTGEHFTDVESSNGPQVNLLVTFGYLISKNFSLSLNAALPFLTRDYNYDGLKRTLTAGFGVSYLFKL